uniref:Uncharacterized protein n=1 Tax=Balaenoptera musculus TaxID=9771 RepID=A0A8C0DBK2_BALMU
QVLWLCCKRWGSCLVANSLPRLANLSKPFLHTPPPRAPHQYAWRNLPTTSQRSNRDLLCFPLQLCTHQSQVQRSLRASRSDSNRVSTSPSRTGPFTFRMMERLVSSMNSTPPQAPASSSLQLTCVHCPCEPVLPSTLVTWGKEAGIRSGPPGSPTPSSLIRALKPGLPPHPGKLDGLHTARIHDGGAAPVGRRGVTCFGETIYKAS